MSNIESVRSTVERSTAVNISGSTTLAQLESIRNNPNRDYGVGPVQGRGLSGRFYKGQLIQRVYNTDKKQLIQRAYNIGEVRFYLKGNGQSHPLPPEITSLSMARTYSRQQIKKETWPDLPAGNVADFKKNSADGPVASMSSNLNQPTMDTGVGTIQGKAPDGRLLTGKLIYRIYSTGNIRYYFKGQNDSHRLLSAITTTAEAKAYVLQQISTGKWTDFDKGDQAVFDKGDSKNIAKSEANIARPWFPEKLRVDFGSAEPQVKLWPLLVFERENIAAVYKAKLRGYLPDAGNARFINFQNNAQGGKDLAEINFSGVSYTKDCNKQTQCAVGLGIFENRGIQVPDKASPEFMKSYKKTARLYGQK